MAEKQDLHHIEKQFMAFVAQNHHTLKSHMALMVRIRDVIQMCHHISRDRIAAQTENRIILFRNKEGQVTILADRPLEFYEMTEGEDFTQTKKWAEELFVGRQGVDELLVLSQTG